MTSDVDALVAHYKRLAPIIELVAKTAKGDEGDHGMRNGAESGPNPCYGQTADFGVVLCQYYGGPSGFMTPLGFLEIARSCMGRDHATWFAVAHELVGLEPFWGDWAKDGNKAVFTSKHHEMGALGPGWTVLRDMEGKPFERTKTKILSWFTMPSTERIVSYKEAVALWAEVFPRVWPR